MADDCSKKKISDIENNRFIPDNHSSSTMASEEEPTQSGALQNSTKTTILTSFLSIKNSIMPEASKHFNFYNDVYQLSPLSWIQEHIDGLSTRRSTNSYSDDAMYHFSQTSYEDEWYTSIQNYWKVDNNEYPNRAEREYEDPVEKCLNMSYNLQCLPMGIDKYPTECDLPLPAVKRALPDQLRISVLGAKPKEAVLTGIFKGFYTCKFGVTVAHLFSALGEGFYAGGELLGYCCAKFDTVQVGPIKVTADLALLSIERDSSIARNKVTVIEIDGKSYRPKLCSIKQVYDIKPGAEVWIVDQFESKKIGKVHRNFYSNEAVGLYNVMQIKTSDGRAVTIEGDSACCVCLPPKPNSDVIEVIGKVIGISELPDKTSCTNATLLPIVLPIILKQNLPLDQKMMEYLCEDEGLPANVNFSQGLDFFSGKISENLTIVSERNIIGSIVMAGQDAGIDLAGI